MNLDDAWLAGVYEGEGTLIGPDRSGQWQMSIRMCDEDVVREVHRLAGVGTITFVHRAEAHWQDSWRWRVCAHADIASVLQRVRPRLGARRGARADLFLNWYQSGARRLRTPEDLAAQAERQRERRRAARESREAERAAQASDLDRLVVHPA